jgi:DNA-directed RNA polymerase specialized sigma24 family protein
MLDVGEYIIDEPHHQFDNGYDQLDGEWLTYYKVATKFVYKAQAQDREDLLHIIILNLAVAGRNNGHKPDNPSWMYRIASFTVAQYWRDYYRRTYGIDCGHCSNQQRKKCKADNLYSDCPRAIRIESLQKPIDDSDGHLTELGELISDDKALDIAEWTDINTFLLGCPQRLIDIAEKRKDGIQLTKYEQLYLCRFWKKHQKRLMGMIAK